MPGVSISTAAPQGLTANLTEGEIWLDRKFRILNATCAEKKWHRNLFTVEMAKRSYATSAITIFTTLMKRWMNEAV